MADRYHEDLGIVSLRKLKEQNSPLYSQTMDWVKNMQEKRDGENGKEFFKWINDNLENQHPFDTLF